MTSTNEVILRKRVGTESERERKNLMFIYLTVAISAKSQNVDHTVRLSWRLPALFQLYLTELRHSNLFMLRTIFLNDFETLQCTMQLH